VASTQLDNFASRHLLRDLGFQLSWTGRLSVYCDDVLDCFLNSFSSLPLPVLFLAVFPRFSLAIAGHGCASVRLPRGRIGLTAPQATLVSPYPGRRNRPGFGRRWISIFTFSITVFDSSRREV